MGVSPPPLRLPKNAITPEQVLRHHRSKRRGGRGDRHCPLLHITCALLFHLLIKGIHQTHFFYVFLFRKHVTFHDQIWCFVS